MEFTFTGDQEAMLETFMQFLGSEEKYMVVQGAAGCGKTTMIKPMLEKVEAFYKMRALLMNQDVQIKLTPYLTATTNPAAAVLATLTDMPVSTIHSFLNLKPRKNFKTGKMSFAPSKDAPIRNHDIIVVDEGSMIDPDLKKNMDALIDDTCKVVVIGDWYQLAAVGETKTVMEQMVCPTAKMNKIMRNSGVIAATGQMFRHTVDSGLFSPIPCGYAELQAVDGPTFQQLVNQVFTAPDYDPSKAKVLAWTNDIVLGYNKHIRSVRGEPDEFIVGETLQTNKPIITKHYNRTVDSLVTITGAGAMHEDGTYSVMGREIELDQKRTMFLPNDQNQVKNIIKSLARKKAWPEYFRLKEEWLDLRVPYASTVHKAQGSGYDTVFINLGDIGRCFVASDVARLLYVAFSRARSQVYTFGELPPRYAG